MDAFLQKEEKIMLGVPNLGSKVSEVGKVVFESMIRNCTFYFVGIGSAFDRSNFSEL